MMTNRPYHYEHIHGLTNQDEEGDLDDNSVNMVKKSSFIKYMEFTFLYSYSLRSSSFSSGAVSFGYRD